MKKFVEALIATLILFAFAAFGLYVIRSSAPDIINRRDCPAIVRLVGVQ